VPAVSSAHPVGAKGPWKMAEWRLVPGEDRFKDYVLIFIYFMNSGKLPSSRRSRSSRGENPYLGARPDKGDDPLLGLRKETLARRRREFPCQAPEGCGKKDMGGDTKHLVLFSSLRWERLSRHLSCVLARIMHEPPAALADMAVLPGASSGLAPCDVLTSTPQVRVPRCRGTVARWHDHLHDLAPASRA
jgi:hypothetical protein